MKWGSGCRRWFLIYLGLGAALTVARVVLFFWLIQRSASHTVTETVAQLQWLLYPEMLLNIHTQLGLLRNPILSFGTFSLILAVGSFLMMTPVVLLIKSLATGWRNRED
jgi:hypothetical protein